MAKVKFQKPPKVKDYGCDQINRLALTVDTIGRMAPDERLRAFNWLKSKFSAEWPSDTYQ